MKAPAGQGGEFKPAPSGAHAAILIQLIDLGTHETEHQGKTKHQRKVRMVFELHSDEAQADDGTPMIVGRNFTLSSFESAALRQFIEGWRGQSFTEEQAVDFDYQVMLGKPCILNITHAKGKNGKTYANIESAMRLMKGMIPPTQHNPSVYFYMGNEASGYAEYDAGVFNGFPQWLKDTIWKSPEYRAATGAVEPEAKPAVPTEAAPFDDEIPF